MRWMTPARLYLPPQPHLGHLKAQARALHRLIRQGSHDDCAELAEVLGEMPAEPARHHAQLLLARRYGFPSWRAPVPKWLNASKPRVR